MIELSSVADIQFLARKGMTTGYEVMSLLTPAAYTAYVLVKRGRSALYVNRILRATWIGGAIGAAGGGALSYARHSSSTVDALQRRRMHVMYDANRLRLEDHAVIGGVLGGVLTTAIFLKRANVVNLILGGGGLGTGLGMLTHYGKYAVGDRPPPILSPSFPE
ncbi:hypothetical protein BD626DRAFT_409117 [Schizophyllum amplum]|uniref:Uncharacterized protein n=1 Tax=Schizophyllum amplum TaxID=97359 RepID=A0A550C3K8_9AGAR|nr:hypothetical protein BD626DRAFT_409117 [Auriculariopsis ampla]